MTSENWELIMNICDKVQEEGETGYVYSAQRALRLLLMILC